MYAMQGSQRGFLRNLSAVLLLFAAILAPIQPTQADELIMKDGSRLIGEVVKRENSTLEYKTSYAGVIKVKWDEVAELRADEPMQLMLDDESTLTANRIKNIDEGLMLDDDIEADLSEPSLAEEELAYINPDPWRTGEGHKLTGQINFAFERERGNTDEDELDIDGNLLWRFKHDRVRMFGELERDHRNNKKSSDNWKLKNHYDHFFTEQWFAGAFLGLEYDRFADLDLRTIIGPKVGYQWFESKAMNLSTEAGPVLTHENFDEDSDDTYLALGWGIDFDRFLIAEFMQFYHRQTGLWSFKDTSNLVWDTWTGLRFPLIWRFVASTEMKVEYDSGAAQDVDDVDTTYTLKIGYKW